MRRITTAAAAACAAVSLWAPASSWAPAGAATDEPATPVVRAQPGWLPKDLGRDATVILTPGTGDEVAVTGADIVGGGSAVGGAQYGRTVGIGFYDPFRPDVRFVNYPQAFGFNAFGRTIDLLGEGTYNDSVDDGTREAISDARKAWAAQGSAGSVILNGYSQSAPVAMNAAYRLHRQSQAGVPGAIGDDHLVVISGADTRFPETGVEAVMPSVIPGLFTNGPRDESATGDIDVIQYCVRGDAVCGMGNPLADPFASAFYLIPGATIHGKLGDQVNTYPVERTWTVGNTTYVVLDAGNPWGVELRRNGVRLPKDFDATLDRLVPVPVPGQAAHDAAGRRIATPREIQQQWMHSLGLQAPVTDPDAVAHERQATAPQNHTPQNPTQQNPTPQNSTPQAEVSPNPVPRNPGAMPTVRQDASGTSVSIAGITLTVGARGVSLGLADADPAH
ncbi:PE-PPE domain-containing protein [Gordonia desulfuricans]|uniref:PE-PPE domain-containing protein n=1 Tax=Gordonia desulfuricans TaxID=89051 RepID=UPI00073F8D66|nr:PE-PPE domain-containing protein [Gordonia desulfuricans]